MPPLMGVAVLLAVFVGRCGALGVPFQNPVFVGRLPMVPRCFIVSSQNVSCVAHDFLASVGSGQSQSPVCGT